MVKIIYHPFQALKHNFAFRLVLILSFCFFSPEFSSLLFSGEYYTSPSGNDNNPGTLNSPFRTIGKGIEKLKAGDILYVRAGTYVEEIYVAQSGTENAPVAIMAYPGESPVIDGENTIPPSEFGSLVQLVGDYVYFAGFEVKNSTGMAVLLIGQHDKASKIKAHHCTENGVLVSGDYGIAEDCEVWQCDLSNSINPGHPASGYWSTGISAARSIVDGITTNAILRRNIVYNNWGEGLSSFEAEGTVIEDNIVYDNWSVNLYVSDTRNALVQRNLVYNTPNNVVGERRPLTLGDENPDVPRSANNIVINNLIYNADLWAFWSTGVPGSGLDNVLIANNTIVNGQLQIGASTADQAVNKSAVICNNIFSSDNGDPWEIMGSLTNLTFSHNLWSAAPPGGLSGTGDVVGDPQLAKTGNNGAGELTSSYFKLLETSPAIDKGTPRDDVPEDFFYTPRGATPDIGACEYVAIPTDVTDVKDTSDSEALLITVNQSVMTIQSNKDFTNKSLRLYNLLGELVFYDHLNGSYCTENVSFLVPGIYIIAISGIVEKKKLLIMN
jgi:parallel beta-helix repeat protein